MFLQQIQNLLPKKLGERVALTHPSSQHLLSRFRGVSRKQPRLPRFTHFSKISLGVVTALYFSGYQPTLAIPPIKQAVVQAQLTQDQAIEALSLPHPFNLPHPGYISTYFSSYHPGIDIATGLGMPVRPVAPGKVLETNFGFLGLGHFVVIEHEQGFRSTYGHMGEIFVKKGDVVDTNSILGEVGLTGRTTGPHTHLEITKDGKYINPLSILPALPAWPTGAGQAPRGAGQVLDVKLPSTPEKKAKQQKSLNNLVGWDYFKVDTKNQDKPKLPPLLLSPAERF